MKRYVIKNTYKVVALKYAVDDVEDGGVRNSQCVAVSKGGSLAFLEGR